MGLPCSDSDWAGDRKSRKSVSSSSAILCNKHYIHGSSKTQKAVAVSSAEAEFHSAVSNSIACTLRALYAFLSPNRTGPPHILVNKPAARAMLQRSGVGRVRRLDAKLLWIQTKVAANS